MHKHHLHKTLILFTQYFHWVLAAIKSAIKSPAAGANPKGWGDSDLDNLTKVSVCE
jgi:hypothetical protein